MATKIVKKLHISPEELGEHNSSCDLWISIHGKVYDVTEWVSNHPGGGIPLLDLAGQDVTNPFTAHHPPSAWKHLDHFFVGHLSEHRSPWMDWFYGGIQFQVEHHLFPRLPRCHLRRIAPIVRELCKKHKLQYLSVGFWEANKRTLETLKEAAVQARHMDISGCRNLIWDALNTHG